MLAAPDAVYPQFASHNAFTIAAVHTLAGDADYEFQCLHGMGESVYDQIVGADKLDRACRIYAPVGSHETLLAYLVRRLLENGANTSFVNRIVDPHVGIADLIADPVAQAEATHGLPHPRIPLPRALLPDRINSRGLDFSADDVLNEHGAAWSDSASDVRAACLERAADMFEAECAMFFALAVREAGKTLPDAIAEVREAADFCRYYAAQMRAMGNDRGTQDGSPANR